MQKPHTAPIERLVQPANGETNERDSLLEKFEKTYAEFKTAFHWSQSEINELFDRVAGSNVDVSESLQDRMSWLYMKSLESSFVQDEKRKVYKVIFEKFARFSQDTHEIRKGLVVDGQPVDEKYVPLRLLVVLEQLSRHEE